MNENIFDKRRLKTFSNCIDLVKSMVGTREGLIAYNQRFRIDLENTCYKASMYNELQDRINKAIEITHKLLMNSADNRMIAKEEEMEYFDWLDRTLEKQLDILKGDNND